MFAQATPGYAKDVRVGVIDIQAAVTGTKEWKKEFASFKIKFQQEKVVIATKEKNLKKMIENLGKQSMVLSPELKRKKEEVLLKKKKEFERHVQDKNDEFAKSEKAITNKILKKMVKIVKDLGESKKFTMILEKKVGLYFDQSVDLTALATRTYNKMK
jgi:outer membrane protein